MATIIPRRKKDGAIRYTVTVRKPGRPSRSKTFSRKIDAKAWATQVEASIERGEFLPSREAQRRTVAELIDRFVAHGLRRKTKKDRSRIANQLAWWKAQLGAYRVGEVTPSIVRRAIRELAVGNSPSGRQLSEATQNRYLAALSRAFSIAVREWGWLNTNPIGRVSRNPEPRGRVRFLSDHERTRLLQACATQSDRLYFLVLMALTTGGRQGELTALTWDDIDFDRGRVVFHDTKNGDRRSAPLVEPALTLAQDRFSQRESRLVFDRASFPRSQWANAVKEARLENFHFHDLRHTFASWCLMSGASLGELAKLLGHKTLQMVQRYSHLTEEHELALVEKMAARYLTFPTAS